MFVRTNCGDLLARITQIMNLLNLAPDIQEALLFLPHTLKGRDSIRERDLRPIAGSRTGAASARCGRRWSPVGGSSSFLPLPPFNSWRCFPLARPIFASGLYQKWLRKSEQGDKWNRCLIEGMIVLSETGARDEQTTPP